MPKYQKTLLTLPEQITETFTALEENPDLRDDYIAALRAVGWTLESIARAAGLTRERIRQIVVNADASNVSPDLEIPLPPERVAKAGPVYIEPTPERLARMLELQPLAQSVRANSPKYREEAEEYTELVNKSYTEDHVTLYRLAKRLGVTHGALRFRLARYGYLKPKEGSSKVYTQILDANRVR